MTFLRWYEDYSQLHDERSVARTGLWHLGVEAEIYTLMELKWRHEQSFNRDPLDNEITWMLVEYYRQNSRYFDRLHKSYGELIDHLRFSPTAPPSDLLSAQFNGRGQMGRYWTKKLFPDSARE